MTGKPLIHNPMSAVHFNMEIIRAAADGDLVFFHIKCNAAVLGEKTMLDTIIPTYNFLEKSFNEGKNLKDIKNEVIEVAKNSTEATKDIIATKGRASYLGERSVGHIDPGAMSSYLMIKTICENI